MLGIAIVPTNGFLENLIRIRLDTSGLISIVYLIQVVDQGNGVRTVHFRSCIDPISTVLVHFVL